MNFNRFKYYLVVDEKNRPMAFSGSQFCYCETSVLRRPHPAKAYTKKEAEKLIEQTVRYRTDNNFTVGEYNLMPIEI